MAELKTQRTDASVDDFLEAIENEQVRSDCQAIAKLMQSATRAKPRMWGPSIVGFGDYRYKYPDGREMDWMLIAFSPRKQNITLYLDTRIEHYDELLAKLGKHSRSKACLHIKRLADVDLAALKQLIRASVKASRKK